MRITIVLLAACNGAPVQKLPSHNVTPQLEARAPSSVCATEIAFTESGRADLVYRYTYDDLGRPSLAKGGYAGGGDMDTITYEWDNLDHMVRMLQTAGAMRAEVVAQYNTLGDLLEYSVTQNGDAQRHAYSMFTDAGLPLRETVLELGQELHYQIEYDASGRITRMAPEAGGPTTIYTYDDDARTIVVDTGNGAIRGVVTFDERNRRLSERWGGTDSQVIANEQVFAWSGDRLLTITTRAGTPYAPHALQFAQLETYRYDCR